MNTISPQWQDLINVFSERNAKINLSAIRDPESIYLKHICDALEIKECLDLGEFSGKKACDIGTGGGFPLLPLAITYPDLTWTGIDARRKKIDAINDMCRQLNLSNCSAIHTRIEEHKQKYDLITARAVTYADTLLTWVDKLLKPGGTAVFYKLFTPEEDGLIQEYGRSVERHNYTLEDDVKRILYVLRKPV